MVYINDEMAVVSCDVVNVHYVVNGLAACSYFLFRLVPSLCLIVFADQRCELDSVNDCVSVVLYLLSLLDLLILERSGDFRFSLLCCGVEGQTNDG